MSNQNPAMTVAEATEITERYKALRIRLLAGDIDDDLLDQYEVSDDYRRHVLRVGRRLVRTAAEFEASTAALEALSKLPEDNPARAYLLTPVVHADRFEVIQPFVGSSRMESMVKDTQAQFRAAQNSVEWAMASVIEPDIYYQACKVLKDQS